TSSVVVDVEDRPTERGDVRDVLPVQPCLWCEGVGKEMAGFARRRLEVVRASDAVLLVTEAVGVARGERHDGLFDGSKEPASFALFERDPPSDRAATGGQALNQPAGTVDLSRHRSELAVGVLTSASRGRRHVHYP